jgi:23S rRNA G2445 N2-methylase RlmL
MCIQALDMQHDKAYTIIASDNDPVMIQYAQINAKNAGVANMITRETKDVCEYEKETIE